MKKTYLVILMILFIHLQGISQNRKIEFIEKPWAELTKMAREQNKLIFLDAYTSWCGPCKWMAKNMFTRDSVADFFNQNFICASIDMEKGEGTGIAAKYKIKLYPTLLFIDSTGNVMHRKAGAPQKVTDYLSLGETAMDPEKRMATVEKKYNNGDRSPALVSSYLGNLTSAYMPVDKVIDEYFAGQKESDYTNRANWQIIYNYVTNPDSKQFQFLIQHQDEFSKLYTEDSVSGKISSVYEQALMQMTRSGRISDSAYILAKQKIRASGAKGIEKSIFNSDLMYFQMKQKKNEFLELNYSDFDKYYSNDAKMLNDIAFTFSLMTIDEKYISKAIEWSKRSNELVQEPNYLNTYAKLLLLKGKKEDAIKKQKAAVELAKKQGKPSEQLEQNLAEMEK